MDHGLAAQLSDRSADLCRLYPEEPARQDHRRALPERRFRQGLYHRPARRARRSGEQADCHRGLLRDFFANGGFKTANPDIFINIATPKFAAQAIKKIAELDWH